jgi:NADPH-dependent 2,4-dienoyl-CoA reductase/sulfur reductase-like enzyme
MMAAVDRGHEVVLYEKDPVLGGNLIGAACPPEKEDLKKYLKWFQRQGRLYGEKCTIKLGVEATPEMVEAEGFDALIIAVGAEAVVPRIPGVDRTHVSWATDAELGKAPVGKELVVIGAGSIGLEAALDFEGQGKKVTVIELLEEGPARFSLFRSGGQGGNELLSLIEKRDNLTVKYGSSVQEILDDRVICKNAATGETFEVPCDTVLLAVGMRPRYDLADSLRHGAPEGSVYIVGDAKESGKITHATNGGFQAGLYL